MYCIYDYCRFENKGNVGEISKWLQPHLKIYQGFGSFQRELTAFFKRKSATAVVVTKVSVCLFMSIHVYLSAEFIINRKILLPKKLIQIMMVVAFRDN